MKPIPKGWAGPAKNIFGMLIAIKLCKVQKRQGGDPVKGTLFGEKDILALGDSVLFSVLKEERARYARLPKKMNLPGRLNGFFDSEFESSWEEETGLPWQEWGKL